MQLRKQEVEEKGTRRVEQAESRNAKLYNLLRARMQIRSVGETGAG